MSVWKTLCSPWAITDAAFEQILSVYHRHARGELPDIKAIEANLGRPLRNEQKPYLTVNRNAIVSMSGTLAKKMNLFQAVSGGSSTEVLKSQLAKAFDDQDVDRILLDTDSPGGSVEGIQELAHFIFENRNTKPVWAISNEFMASGAVWVGAAAERVILASPTTQIGSIGVIAMHTDETKRETELGYTNTIIKAGKWKAARNSYKALGKDEHDYLQAQIDEFYRLFVEDVALFRDTPTKTVLDQMADARMFIGRQAIDAGLADEIATLDDLVASVVEPSSVTITVPDMEPTEEDPMPDAKQTKAQPAQAAAVLDVATVTAQYPAIAEALQAEGAAAECARIKGVYAQSYPGHEALIEGFMFDGKTTEGRAAMAVIVANKAQNATALATIQAEAPTPAPPSADITPPFANKPVATDDDPQAIWDADEKIRAEFGKIETFKAYFEAEKNGQVRVTGGRHAR